MAIQLDGETTVTRTIAEDNEEYGYVLVGGQMTLERSVARGNTSGVQVNGGTARIGSSAMTNNLIGIRQSGGAIFTRENNTVSGNGTDVSATLTPLGGI